MKTNKIGLNATQIKDGSEVYYYPWYDKATGNHAEGIKTKIKGDCIFNSASNYVCFVDDVRGYVLISHLSFEYYPEKYIKQTNAKRNYEDYLNADCSESFSEWLGIDSPKLHTAYSSGFHRYESVKYHSVKGDYFRFKKDAKKSYKEKLRAYLKSRK